MELQRDDKITLNSKTFTAGNKIVFSMRNCAAFTAFLPFPRKWWLWSLAVWVCAVVVHSA